MSSSLRDNAIDLICDDFETYEDYKIIWETMCSEFERWLKDNEEEQGENK